MDTLKAYLPLCWFKLNPLELTRSVDFFKKNLIFYMVVEFFLQANMTDDPLESFYEVSFATALTLLFVGIVLSLSKSLYAFVQVSTSILFCSNAVAFFLIPVLVWLTVSDSIASYYFTGFLIAWNYALVTYIIKRVLSLNIPASAVVSLCYVIFAYFGAFTLGQLVQ
jgi:hypothetical protein